MESFHWGKHFETAIASVDEQHHGLVDLINEFGELLIQPGAVSGAAIEDLFNRLATYAQYHFEEEEALMQEAGLDPHHVQSHVLAHTRFVRDVTLLHDGVAQRPQAAHELLKFLTYWLAYHILGSDQDMAKQIRAIGSGQTPEAAYRSNEIIQSGATEPLLVALNGLFQQVSERNRELMELNRTLEEKVTERTLSLSQANQRLEQIALTDVLTGLPNRRHAMAWLEHVWVEAEKDDSPLSCVMIDADGFKQVNDRYGHEAGDEVLRQLARQLRYCVRTDDTVCRLGGDEFLIICPGTDLDGALLAAEAVRRDIAQMRVSVTDGGQWVGSVSMGVAARVPAMKTFDAIIKLADDGLYIAKRRGRNCVACGHDAPDLKASASTVS